MNPNSQVPWDALPKDDQFVAHCFFVSCRVLIAHLVIFDPCGGGS